MSCFTLSIVIASGDFTQHLYKLFFSFFCSITFDNHWIFFFVFIFLFFQFLGKKSIYLWNGFWNDFLVMILNRVSVKWKHFWIVFSFWFPENNTYYYRLLLVQISTFDSGVVSKQITKRVFCDLCWIMFWRTIQQYFWLWFQLENW